MPAVQETVKSTPDPEIPVLVGGVLRTIVAFGAGYGASWAQNVTGNQIELAVGVVMAVGTLLWSIYQKTLTAKREHEIAVMSAKGGTAVQPEKVVI